MRFHVNSLSSSAFKVNTGVNILFMIHGCDLSLSNHSFF